MAFRYLLVALTVVLGFGFSSCGNDEAAKKQAKADSIARAKHEQDSIARAMADSVAAAEAEEPSQLDEAPMEESPAEEVVASSDGLRFHVIKGSFTIPENADNFLAVQQSSHPQAKIFTAPNGFKLVSIADFGTMQEAVAMINSQGGGESRLWVYQEGGPYNTSAWLEEKSGMGGGDSFSGGSSSAGASADDDFGFDEGDEDAFGDDDEFEE